MREALALALEARAAGEVPVGAIVVMGDEIVGRGRNSQIGANDPTAHAEMLALREACGRIGNYRLPGAVVYSTLEPCVMCAGALMHARVARVVFGAPDPKTGACGSVLNPFADAHLNHHTIVDGGILAEECGELVRAFFSVRRSSSA